MSEPPAFAVRRTLLGTLAVGLTSPAWAIRPRADSPEVAIEPLLVEVAATGHAVLFIDGLDRIAPEQQAVVTDLLGQILTSPALAEWRIVATARDAGIEPVRNSRLVLVHFDSPDPAFSERAANAIAEAYIASNLERRFDSSAYAKTYLEDRLQELRLKLRYPHVRDGFSPQAALFGA